MVYAVRSVYWYIGLCQKSWEKHKVQVLCVPYSFWKALRGVEQMKNRKPNDSCKNASFLGKRNSSTKELCSYSLVCMTNNIYCSGKARIVMECITPELAGMEYTLVFWAIFATSLQTLEFAMLFSEFPVVEPCNFDFLQWSYRIKLQISKVEDITLFAPSIPPFPCRELKKNVYVFFWIPCVQCWTILQSHSPTERNQNSASVGNEAV